MSAKKRFRGEVTISDLDDFLKRPKENIQNLNRSLRKSYGKNFFKNSQFDGFRELTKRKNQKEADSVQSECQTESVFSLTAGKQQRKKQQVGKKVKRQFQEETNSKTVPIKELQKKEKCKIPLLKQEESIENQQVKDMGKEGQSQSSSSSSSSNSDSYTSESSSESERSVEGNKSQSSQNHKQEVQDKSDIDQNGGENDNDSDNVAPKELKRDDKSYQQGLKVQAAGETILPLNKVNPKNRIRETSPVNGYPKEFRLLFQSMGEAELILKRNKKTNGLAAEDGTIEIRQQQQQAKSDYQYGKQPPKRRRSMLNMVQPPTITASKDSSQKPNRRDDQVGKKFAEGKKSETKKSRKIVVPRKMLLDQSLTAKESLVKIDPSVMIPLHSSDSKRKGTVYQVLPTKRVHNLQLTSKVVIESVLVRSNYIPVPVPVPAHFSHLYNAYQMWGQQGWAAQVAEQTNSQGTQGQVYRKRVVEVVEQQDHDGQEQMQSRFRTHPSKIIDDQ